MKKTITILSILITLVSCKKDSTEDNSSSNTENNNTSIAEDYYDCTNFFDSGDYSSLCNINTSIPNDTVIDISGSGTVCSYVIPPLDTTQVNSGIYFLSLETSDQAISMFDNRKTQSDTNSINDTSKFHTNTTISGYDGYISEGRFANYSKSVSVRYNNVIVTTSAVYYKDWFPLSAPCNYETPELISLMEVVLQNM